MGTAVHVSAISVPAVSSLADIQTACASSEAFLGPLMAIGNNGTDTILTFRHRQASAQRRHGHPADCGRHADRAIGPDAGLLWACVRHRPTHYARRLREAVIEVVEQ
jgi:hypothetical protein